MSSKLLGRRPIGRGKTWQQLLGEGLGFINADARDETLRAVDAPRSAIPGIDLRFEAPAARYDLGRHVVTFLGAAGGATVRCGISREALDDHFGADGLDREGCVRQLRENRETIERMLAKKYLMWPVEEVGSVLIKSDDVDKLRAKHRG